MKNGITLTPAQRAEQRDPKNWTVEPSGTGAFMATSTAGRTLMIFATSGSTYDIASSSGGWYSCSTPGGCNCPDATTRARIEGRLCLHEAACAAVHAERQSIALEIDAARQQRDDIEDRRRETSATLAHLHALMGAA